MILARLRNCSQEPISEYPCTSLAIHVQPVLRLNFQDVHDLADMLFRAKVAKWERSLLLVEQVFERG